MQQIILSLKTLHDWWLPCERLKYDYCHYCFFQTKLPDIRRKVISRNFKFKRFPDQAAPYFVAGPQWQSLHTTKLICAGQNFLRLVVKQIHRNTRRSHLRSHFFSPDFCSTKYKVAEIFIKNKKTPKIQKNPKTTKTQNPQTNHSAK